MGRKVRRSPVRLDSRGIGPLSDAELKTILRGADDLIMKGGRSLLARVLKGSKQKAVLEKEFDRSPVYGAMRELSIEEITKRIDWTIENGYLAYEYDYRLPLLVYTSAGWEIERETFAEEKFARLEREVEQDPESAGGDWFGDQHPQVLELVAERIADSGNERFLPFLRRWQGKASRRIRKRIRSAMDALEGE